MRRTCLTTGFGFCFAAVASACAPSSPPSDSAVAVTPSAVAPGANAAPAIPPPSASEAPPASALPAPGASSSAAASASGAVPGEAPPAVKVVNIGMHIGGGPNDAATKAPIGSSIAPHFPELARCFARVDDPKKGGDFGIDLQVPAAGGKAEASHPRTTLRGEGFSPCVLAVLSAIDFQKPKGGATVVSYSLRFTPEK
ncbi:MAG: hypothetical protein WKG00_19405 [Polyangiaceae bacterium]